MKEVRKTLALRNIESRVWREIIARKEMRRHWLWGQGEQHNLKIERSGDRERSVMETNEGRRNFACRKKQKRKLCQKKGCGRRGFVSKSRQRREIHGEGREKGKEGASLEAGPKTN